MLRLTNISKSDGFISANYYPEGKEPFGFVKISIENCEIVESAVTPYDYPFNIYLSHAIKALERYRDSDNVPSNELVMWY